MGSGSFNKATGIASGCMALYSYFLNGRVVELHRGGTLFGMLSSAFLAELLALEWALEVIHDMKLLY